MNETVMPRRNIEIKARLASLAAAREVAQRLATDYVGVQRQVDTYFHCRDGRLKLRETDGRTGQLIAYSRPDQIAPKDSDYHLIAVEDAAGLKAALTAALGVCRVVRKFREVFLVENVRIHLDDVEHLGTFLELEAVLEQPHRKDADPRADFARVERLLNEFNICEADLLPGSYAEMVSAAGG